MAFRRGRGSRKSREKKMSWKPVSLCRASSRLSASSTRWPILSFRIWV